MSGDGGAERREVGMRREKMKLGDGGRKGDNGEDMRWMKTHRGWWGNGCGGREGKKGAE